MRKAIFCIGVLACLAVLSSACVMPVVVPPADGGTDATAEGTYGDDSGDGG